MAADTHRFVTLGRVEEGVYVATNARGNELRFGSNDPDGFSPVELLMAAIAGCSAIDVDIVTGRRSPAETFQARVDATYVRDDTGNSLDDITLTIDVTFPVGGRGDAAREILPRTVARSHDRLCTVTRTIELGRQVRTVVVEP
ncbi:OsmC family protein [Angustibacter sp. McL0619]|uniref:OsmC family protein n=1 Tax=Angustibacter sp. McL0619 TaxID=3415676 RepID=UPI003CF3775F